MMKKKLTICILACVLILAGSFGGTYAYLKAIDTAKNILYVGENNITVNEPSFTEPDTLEKGLIINKDPSVKNTGNLPCYVRMMIYFSNDKAKEFCEVSSDKEISEFCSFEDFDDQLKKKDNGWILNEEDGCYYYTEILPPGKETEPLFTAVKISEEYENPIIEFDLTVIPESIEAGEFENYKDAWKSWESNELS